MSKTSVLVTGTFNILHAGHIRLLEFAATFGKVVVGINSDKYLYEKYGESKTIPLVDRVYVLSSNVYVDEVYVFNENTPANLILNLKPDYYIKGPDYFSIKLPEQYAIDKVGCNLIIQPIEKEYNSSNLINSLNSKVFKKLNKY